MICVKIGGLPHNIELNHFTDGTLKLNIPILQLPAKEATVVWRYENEEELSAVIQLTLHLREHGMQHITLNMPYIPNARQDRVQSDSEVFTLKHFAKIINWLHFDEVCVLDAHSRVSLALFDRIVNRSPQPYIEEAIKRIGSDKIVAFFPDEGAMKRYGVGVSHLYPVAFGMKTRDPHTGRVDGLKIYGNIAYVRNSDILIVDDICARGDTALRCAQELKKAGANHVFLFVSHCENTILDSELITSNILERVYTTPSIFTKAHEKIEIIN